MLDLNTVYLLDIDADNRGALHLEPKDDEIDDEGLFFGKVNKKDKVVYTYLQGKKPYDIIGCSFPHLNIISKNFYELLKDNRVSGWDSYPVEVLKKGKVLLNDYYGLSIKGKCGPILDEKSNQMLMPPKVPSATSYYAYVGLYFDPNTWDGSDIFCPEGSYHIFVTEKVKNLIEQAGITNVLFGKITEIENLSPDLW